MLPHLNSESPGDCTTQCYGNGAYPGTGPRP